MHAKLSTPHQYFSNAISVITSFLLLSLFIPSHDAKNDSKLYKACSNMHTSPCGNPIRGILDYPFWVDDIRSSDCGLKEFELKCENSDLVLDVGPDSKYHVVGINPSTSVLTLNRDYNLLDYICESSTNQIQATKLNDALYNYGENTEDLDLFYHCGEEIEIESNFTCPNDNNNQVFFFLKNSFSYAQKHLSSCNYTTLPVSITVLKEFPVQVQPPELFKGSFEVYYNRINQQACKECYQAGGLCWRGTNMTSNDRCLYQQSGLSGEENGQETYPPGNNPETNPPGKHQNLGLKFAAASGVVGCSILLLVVLIICRRRMRTKYSSSYHKDIEAFISQYGSSIPRRFRYSMLKKITNSFKDELGKGGYGNVYRGRLADGRVVAVKVLKETKGNGEEFINEVASIGRTSHVNVVALLGFCYDGKRRALIYEFMPNGSLEKFIYGKSPSLEEQHLGWEKLYSIAIGIARGLEYLHRGCNTRILHFDIKPHNILLDENFRPKISDFGLAKLYSTDESIISSLLQARGTIGYIAPEVTSRNFGQVSHKSDVYSYGMMILEMVGGRKNVNAGADQTSEIYYPRWLYKRIQSDDMLNLANGISVEENEIVRKMVIVGLWCIQIYPSERPSISKVIEMLEGQAAALEIPPRPYSWSVPSSPSDSQKKMVFSSSSGTEPTSSA